MTFTRKLNQRLTRTFINAFNISICNYSGVSRKQLFETINRGDIFNKYSGLRDRGPRTVRVAEEILCTHRLCHRIHGTKLHARQMIAIVCLKSVT